MNAVALVQKPKDILASHRALAAVELADELGNYTIPEQEAMLDDRVLEHLVEQERNITQAALLHMLRLARTQSFMNLAAGYTNLWQYLSVKGVHMADSAVSNLEAWAKVIAPAMEKEGLDPESVVTDFGIGKVRLLTARANEIVEKKRTGEANGKSLTRMVEEFHDDTWRSAAKKLYPGRFTDAEDIGDVIGESWEYENIVIDEDGVILKREIRYGVWFDVTSQQFLALERAGIRPMIKMASGVRPSVASRLAE